MRELYSHIDKNSGGKFEDMFLVIIASKGTSLSHQFHAAFMHSVQITQVGLSFSTCDSGRLYSQTLRNVGDFSKDFDQ